MEDECGKYIAEIMILVGLARVQVKSIRKREKRHVYSIQYTTCIQVCVGVWSWEFGVGMGMGMSE